MSDVCQSVEDISTVIAVSSDIYIMFVHFFNDARRVKIDNSTLRTVLGDI